MTPAREAPARIRSRIAAAVIVGAAALSGSVLGLAATSASAAASSDAPPIVAVGEGNDVDAFVFSSFDAEYALGRDEAGASTLTTVETLVAEFPDRDQNRGIRRAIPLEYDGHTTGLEIVSVTDGDGAEREFETESEDGFELVTIADDDFVRGTQTYVITYRETDVTRFFADTGSDEFYRDINGTAWRQSFGNVSATVMLEGDLAELTTGDVACYRGPEGSTDQCTVDPASSGVIAVSEDDLAPGENVSISVGFERGTFTPWDGSFGASGLVPLFVVGLIALLLAVAAAVVGRLTVSRDARGRASIVTEFLPPAEPELPVLAVVIGKRSKAVAATLVSFAVRRIARILDDGGTYSLQYVGDGKPIRASARRDLAPVEARLAGAFFGTTLTPGEKSALTGSDGKVGTSIQAALKAADEAAVAQGYRRPVPRLPLILVALLSLAAAVVLFVTGVSLLDQGRATGIAVLSILLAVVAVLPIGFVWRQPLTESGAEARDHLRGIRRYLEVAEEERIRLLQSVEGADRVEVDGEQVVRVYERLLPYAVLLGVDRSWSAVLGDAYERAGTTPEWFAGQSSFSSVAFASGIHSMSSSTTAFAASAGSSSSSGGSGGGGFSGGGGGGGGGGGV